MVQAISFEKKKSMLIKKLLYVQTRFYLCKTQSPILELIELSQFNHKITSQNLFSAHTETFHGNHKNKLRKICLKIVRYYYTNNLLL